MGLARAPYANQVPLWNRAEFLKRPHSPIYRKGMTSGPRRKTGRGGGGGGDNAAPLGGEISSGAAAWGSSGCCPGLSTLHDLTPSCSVQIGQM